MPPLASQSFLQRIAPVLVAHLWQVQALPELPLDIRETIATVLGSEGAARGLHRAENPNAYGVEPGELLEALAL